MFKDVIDIKNNIKNMKYIIYMLVAKRNGKPWTVAETIRLERECELLELSVEEIAELHSRTIRAIMFKLDAENLSTFCKLYRSLRQNTHTHF